MSPDAPPGTALRIAMVCPYSLSRPGGVQGQAIGLARALRRGGHHVAVLAPADRRSSVDDGDAVDQSGGIDGLLTVPIGRALGVASNGSVAPVALSPLSAARVERFVRDHRVDVVHLHEPFAPLAGYGVLWRHPVPVVGTFHRSGGSKWYRGLGPVARAARRRIDLACAVSEAARQTAVDALGGEYEVLFNGVDTERFAGAVPRPTAGRTTVVFIGRHEERKGLGVLLDAFTRLDSGQLWVGGSGPRTAELRRRYPPSERLRWLGVLSEADKASVIAGADVLCAPSLGGESFGVVLLEAMAGRCVLVASDIDGYRQASGGHATLVAPGDAQDLADTLRDVLAEVSEGRGRASSPALDAGSKHAQGWSLQRLAREYEERYRRVIA